jgi:ABC-type dipeptide/oligopeptide/nickel transport system permease subunit/ABC-type dipeptide/oligopeptide/nickel transport system permease component
MRRVLPSLSLFVVSALTIAALLLASPAKFRTNLSWSESNGQPVWNAIADRLPATIELFVAALVASALLGAIGGFVRGRVRRGALPEVLALPELVFRATPVVFVALIGQLFFVFTTSLPTAGYATGDTFQLRDHLVHLAGPVLFVALPFGAWSSLIFYDLFRTPNGATARRFAGAVATTAASVGPALLSASVILEVLFAWPGMGRLFFNAFSQDDLALIAAVLLVYSAVIALLKLGADFSPGIPAPAPNAAVPKRFSVLAFVACAVLLVAAFAGLSANLIAPANPNFIDQVHWQGYPLPPGAAGHVLGTDENGRDLLSRLFFAIRTSFGIAVFAAIVATAIAARVARAAPWFAAARGPLSVAGIRPFAALPFIMAALYVVFKFHNPRVVNPIGLGLIFAAVSWPALVPAFRQSSAAALGAFADVTGGALLLEVTVSFFGFGVQAPGASLGNTLANAQSNMMMAPWAVIAQLTVIVVLLFALFALGEELRELRIDLFAAKERGRAAPSTPSSIY